MLEQRGPDAAVAASTDDVRTAVPEAARLELPGVSYWPASAADAVWAVGRAPTDDGLVGVAPAVARATRSTTVRSRGCSLRRSPGGHKPNPPRPGGPRPARRSPRTLPRTAQRGPGR